MFLKLCDFILSEKGFNMMRIGDSICLKVLLDVCQISYTDKQLRRLTNLLSKLYILRNCFVNLEEISPDSELSLKNRESVFGDKERFSPVKEKVSTGGKENFQDSEEITPDTEEIYNDTEENFKEIKQNFSDSDESYEPSDEDFEDPEDITENSRDVRNSPIVISLKPKRKNPEKSELKDECSQKKLKLEAEDIIPESSDEISEEEGEAFQCDKCFECFQIKEVWKFHTKNCIKDIGQLDCDDPEIISVSFSNKGNPKNISSPRVKQVKTEITQVKMRYQG